MLIGKAPNELTRRKYHAECSDCGANVDSVRITCSECGDSFCKSCSDIETGVCHRCTKKAVRKSSGKGKPSGRTKQQIDSDDGSGNNGEGSKVNDGGSKPVPSFGATWGASKKG